MMEDVADQEERRERKRCEHGGAMSGDAPRTDEGEADQQRRGAEAVEDSVKGWQKSKLYAGCVRRWMHIDKPEKKERGYDADGKDRRYEWSGTSGGLGSLCLGSHGSKS